MNIVLCALREEDEWNYSISQNSSKRKSTKLQRSMKYRVEDILSHHSSSTNMRQTNVNTFEILEKSVYSSR